MLRSGRLSFAVPCVLLVSAFALREACAAQSAARAGDRLVYRISCVTTITDSAGYTDTRTSTTYGVVRVQEWSGDSGSVYLSVLPSTTIGEAAIPRTQLDLAIDSTRRAVRVSGFTASSLNKLASQLLSNWPASAQLREGATWQRAESIRFADGKMMRMTAAYCVTRTFTIGATPCAEVTALVDGNDGPGGRVLNLHAGATHVVACDTGEVIAADLDSTCTVLGRAAYACTTSQEIRLQTCSDAFQPWLRENKAGAGKGRSSAAAIVPMKGDTSAAGADRSGPPSQLLQIGNEALFASGLLATGAVTQSAGAAGAGRTGGGLLVPVIGIAQSGQSGAASAVLLAGGAGAAAAPAKTGNDEAGGGGILWVIGGLAAAGGTAAALSGGGGGGGDDGTAVVPVDNNNGGDGGTGGLSDVTVDSVHITLTLYDHSTIDGDRIDLIINDQTLLSNFTLPGPPGYVLEVSLKAGLNSLKVLALNEGAGPPNTAALVISNVTVGNAAQQWRLDTGETASLTIAAP